jgi:tetratricopeptide (TPR) repeat protein
LPLTVPKSARLEDPGAQLLSRASALSERYGRIALVVLGALVAIAAVAFLTLRSRAASEAEAAGRLAQANMFYWQGEYPRSLEMARQVYQQYGSTPSGLEAHRLAGDNAYWDGDFKTAVSEYQTYLARQKKGLLADAGRRSLAYALESNKQYAEAAPVFESLVGVFDRESSAECLAAAARCYRALNQPAEAVKRLQRVVDEFGETSYANMAQVELAELSAPVR